MGMALCHAMEMLPKMRYDGPLYLTVNRTLYLLFGAPLGASVEVGAVVSSIGLVFLVRRHRLSFVWSLAAAVCMVAAQILWWIWVNPANTALALMTIQAPSPEWIHWRNQWEYTHLARFCLQAFALSMLTISVLRETPEV
jgi:hypothetical protein